MPIHRMEKKIDHVFTCGGPDETPKIEPHSKAKLTVLREYIRAYINRLATGFTRDEFKLDFVDGFAGGGIFQDGEDLVSGSPLVMLEETEAAKENLKCCPQRTFQGVLGAPGRLPVL